MIPPRAFRLILAPSSLAHVEEMKTFIRYFYPEVCVWLWGVLEPPAESSEGKKLLGQSCGERGAPSTSALAFWPKIGTFLGRRSSNQV